MLIPSNGGTIWCERVGQGPPVLIPGYASTSRFLDIARYFSDRFTVVGCDVRGEGLRTDFPAGDYTLDDLADDLAGVLDALDIDRAHYIGHSHTGMVGIAFALAHARRVERLVLTNTGPGLERRVDAEHELPVAAGEYTNAMVAADAGDPDGLRRLGALMLSPEGEADARLLAATTDFFRPVFGQPAEERARTWAAYGSWSARDRLGEVTAPTLVLTSDRDRMTSFDDAMTLWRDIPNAALVALHGVGHDWLTEAPAAGAAVVRAFLTGVMDRDVP